MPLDRSIQHARRGCECDYHAQARVKQREYRERKERGEPPKPKVALTTKNENPRNPGSRLVETRTNDALTVHWMPKNAMEWECPQCGAWFLKVAGEWKEPWVA